MRVLPLCLLATLFTSVLPAQEQYSMLHEDARWVHKIEISDDFQPDTFYTEVYLLGDTVLNGRTYRRLYSEAQATLFEQDRYVGAVREDSNRLYIVRAPLYGDTTETIALDFNLTAGDTTYYACEECGPAVVTSVDTIILSDGLARKRIHLSLLETPDVEPRNISWIDGIGSTFGFPVYRASATCGLLVAARSLSPVCFQELVCAQQAGQVLFNRAGRDVYSCTLEGIISAAGTPDAEAIRLTLLPNPAREELALMLENNTAAATFHWEIFDLKGQVLLRGSGPLVSRQTTISLSTLPPGYYLLRLRLAAHAVIRPFIRMR